MSSDEDEFFDAPNAFLSSAISSKWSDSNEELNQTALENVSKNAERRNRVESLRRTGISNFGTAHSGYDNPNNGNVSKNEFNYQPLLRSPNDTLSNHSIIKAVLLQQQLIKKLQEEPNLCQCMKNLLSTISQSRNDIIIPDKVVETEPHLVSMTQSCPECCQPISSLAVTLDWNNIPNYIKSWSLDSAKIIEGEKKRLSSRGNFKEFSNTVPAQSPGINELNTNLFHSIKTPHDSPSFNSSLCPESVVKDKFHICQPQIDLNKTLSIDSSLHNQTQRQLILESTKTAYKGYDDLKTISLSTCACNKPKYLNSTGESFSRHDSMKLNKIQKDNSDVKINVKSLTNTLNSEIPPEMNPIELQFRERTKSMDLMLKESRTTSLQRSEESVRNKESSDMPQRTMFNLGGTVKKFQKNVKNALSAVSRAKIFNPDEESSSEDEEFVGNRGIRLRSSRRMKGRRDFLQIKLVQEMKDEHIGAIWAMRFSPCGKLLATAGYDRAIRVWVLRQYYWYFKQYQKTAGAATSSNSNSDKVESDFDLIKQPMMNDDELGIDSVSLASTSISTGKTDFPTGCGSTCSSGDDDIEQGRRTPFRSKPLIIYRGHQGVVTDLVWSKNLFLLATSMDRQVRLWHISRRECLCIFNHNDTVPTVVFHPKDDRYFLSGSLDGKLRLWNIPDKKIRCWVEALLPNSLPMASVFSPLKSSSNSSLPPKTVITCAAFVCEATKIVVGTYDGRILFYTAELEYITSMAIKSSYGKNRHCRVTATEVDPTDSCKILVTANDSRVRLIDARDYHIICKYRGFVNSSSQIRASFSPTGKYVISGSENSFFYIWKKDVEVSKMTRFSTTRKDRNNYWEAIKAHETVVSVTAFSPSPHLVLDKRFRRRHSINMSTHPYVGEQYSTLGLGVRVDNYLGEVIVSADINGVIRVFKNRIHSHPISAKQN